jgi:AcrR family transcriptional regulator
MATTRRKPRARRTVAVETQERILDAAERLFALHGIEAVSLRQIGAAAGAANHFAVQYHFGDKPRLVRAIFERRLPSLDVRRARWLMEIKREGREQDPYALLKVLLWPLAEEVDADGRRTYAAFLLGLHRHGASEARIDAADLAPMTAHVTELLHAANAAVPPVLSRVRYGSAFVLFADTLANLDRRRATGALTAEQHEILLDDAIAMAAAAFTAAPTISSARYRDD